jgi:hypothetical protein
MAKSLMLAGMHSGARSFSMLVATVSGALQTLISVKGMDAVGIDYSMAAHV